MVAWVTVALSSVPAVGGLQINLTFDAANSDNPDYDPNGIGLGKIVDYVASVFEDIIEDEHTLDLTYRWDADLQENESAIGIHYFGDEQGGREVKGEVRFETELLYYIDPTPADDSEYDMEQRLFRDLPGDRFKGNVPDVFEAGFNGQPRSDAPPNAQNGRDLLTLVFQEVGHALGLSAKLSSLETETGKDADFDVNPDFVGGSVMALTTRSGDDTAHLRGNDAVMASLSATERTRPSAADILAMAAVSGWTNIDLRRQDFLVGSAWDTAGNWLGNQVPGWADDAFVRHGGTVVLSSQDTFVENLLIAEDSSVTTGDNRLTVLETLTLDRGELLLDGGSAETNRLNIAVGGVLAGHGQVDLTGVLPKLTNSGLIQARHGQTLQIGSSDTIALDLDGDAGGGRVEAVLGSITFQTGLTDPFGGLVTVGAGRTVNFEDGWTLDGTGGLTLDGSSTDAATLRGGISEFDGNIQVLDKAVLDFTIMGTFKPLADVILVPGATLEVKGITVFEGGDVDLADGATLKLAGATTIQSGFFDVPDGARLELNGATVFEGGSYQGAGTMVQNGSAAFKEDTTIDVDFYDWDGATGGGAITVIDPGVAVTINSTDVERSIDFDGYDGDIYLNGGIMNVNTAGPWGLDGKLVMGEWFTQDGLFTPSVGGQEMIVSGRIEVSGHGRISADVSFRETSATIVDNPSDVLTLSGDIRFANGAFVGKGMIRQNGDAVVASSTTIHVATYDLDGKGGSSATTIQDGAKLTFWSDHIDANHSDTFDGTLNIAGELAIHNEPNAWTMNGVLNFDDGVVSGAPVEVTGEVYGDGTFDTDVKNFGLLGPGGSPGEISVLGTYEQDASGVLDLEIGGLVPVDDFDRLWIFGDAAFAGTLNLTFIDGFAPQTGQTFELIRTDGLVTGDFTTTNIANLEAGFLFSAEFDRRGVFRLTALNDGVFIPEPSTLTLAAIALFGLLAVARRNRRKGLG